MSVRRLGGFRIRLSAGRVDFKVNDSTPAIRRALTGAMLPADKLALRPTVIAGERGEDDYVIIWDGLSIGRILKQPGVPHGRPNWSWGVHFPHNPQLDAHRGLCSDLEECKRRFKVAWSAIHRDLSERDVTRAHEQAAAIADRPWNRRRE